MKDELEEFEAAPSTLGSVSSRFGSPVVDPPPNKRGLGKGTRAHKTAGNRAYFDAGNTITYNFLTLFCWFSELLSQSSSKESRVQFIGMHGAALISPPTREVCFMIGPSIRN